MPKAIQIMVEGREVTVNATYARFRKLIDDKLQWHVRSPKHTIVKVDLDPNAFDPASFTIDHDPRTASETLGPLVTVKAEKGTGPYHSGLNVTVYENGTSQILIADPRCPTIYIE